MNTLGVAILLIAVIFAALALIDNDGRWGYRLTAVSALLISVYLLLGKAA